jgi:large subunit ribosomal protein L10
MGCGPPDEATLEALPPGAPGWVRLDPPAPTSTRGSHMPTKADAESAQIQRKAAVIDEIRERLDGSEAAVLTEYRGLTVAEIAALRAALRPAATDYKVFKNTLARRAAAAAGLEDLAESLSGPVAIAFVRKDGDAVTAAKALRDFAKGNPNLVLKGGILGPRPLTTADVEALADVPPRELLLARLAGGFQAPLTKAAGLFQAFTRNMAYGVKAYIDQRIEGGEAAPADEPEPEPSPEPDPEAPAAETEAEAETEAPAAEPQADAPPTEHHEPE